MQQNVYNTSNVTTNNHCRNRIKKLTQLHVQLQILVFPEPQIKSHLI